jgi:fido (protein-threonine AMPylation protein)
MRNPADHTPTGEPGRSEKAAAWQSAIGLQAADGLSVSDSLREASKKHVSGQLTLEELRERIFADPEREEADKVAVNTVKILLSDTLHFSTEGLIALHHRIFDGVYENAGVLRDYEEYKREWVLGGDSISFTRLEALQGALEDSIAREKDFAYEKASSDKLITQLSSFVAELWHICPFGGDGNTRFTAVFTLLYLRHLGINIKIDTFVNDSWYFHNALVRANYRDLVKKIDYEPIYLERFFRNMLLSEQWDLRNRYVHVRPAAEWSVQPKANNKTTTGQVQVKNTARKSKESDKQRTSEIRENEAENPNLLFLAVAIGEDFLSVKEIMDKLKLKGRDNFLKLYLTPALQRGIVAQLYPAAPRHPRQKYLLSPKGMEFLKAAGPEMVARVERHLTRSGI